MGSLQLFSRDTLDLATQAATTYASYALLLEACDGGVVPSLRAPDKRAISSFSGALPGWLFAGAILITALKADGYRVFEG